MIKIKIKFGLLNLLKLIYDGEFYTNIPIRNKKWLNSEKNLFIVTDILIHVGSKVA